MYLQSLAVGGIVCSKVLVLLYQNVRSTMQGMWQTRCRDHCFMPITSSVLIRVYFATQEYIGRWQEVAISYGRWPCGPGVSVVTYACFEVAAMFPSLD